MCVCVCVCVCIRVYICVCVYVIYILQDYKTLVSEGRGTNELSPMVPPGFFLESLLGYGIRRGNPLQNSVVFLSGRNTD